MNTASLNRARLNGTTRRDDTLRLFAGARSTATNSVRRPMSAQCSSASETYADGLKITGVSLAAAEAVAADHAVAVRVVKPTAIATAEVAGVAEPTRSAYFDGRHTAEGEASLTAPWARRPFDGEASVAAESQGSAERTAWMAGSSHLGSASIGMVAGRTRPFTAYTVAEATGAASAERTAWMAPSTAVAEADQTEAFERHAYFIGAACEAVSESQGDAHRTAWGRFNIAMGIADRIGRPVRTAWMAPSSTVAEVAIEASPRRTTRMLSDVPSTIEAYAEQQLSSSALYWRTPEPMDVTAEAVLEATRYAWAPAPAMEATATFAFDATRYGWSYAESQAEALLSVDALRTAWAIPEAMVAEAETSASGWHTYFADATSEAYAEASVEYRWWSNAQLRPIRTASITWLAESRLEVLRVRQRAMSATGIARSSSRALPNTKILLGTLASDAETRNAEGSLRLYHDFRAVAEAGVESVTQLGRITVISGNPNAVAETRVAPTITRGGVRYPYVTARSVAEAVQHCDGLNITGAALEPGRTDALTQGVPYVQHAFWGAAAVLASAIGLKTRKNRWLFFGGASTAAASASGRAINLRWVGMEGAAQAVAEGRLPGLIHYRWTPMEGMGEGEAAAAGENIRYRWVGVEAITSAEALSSADEPQRIREARPVVEEGYAESVAKGVREVRPDIEATGIAAVDLSVTVYAWRFVELRMVGTCDSSADGLRNTWAPDADPMEAVAGDVRVSFKINAGSPAPPRRTLVVAPENREYRLPATKREYQIA